MPAQLTERASMLKSHLDKAIKTYHEELTKQQLGQNPLEEEIYEAIDRICRERDFIDLFSAN